MGYYASGGGNITFARCMTDKQKDLVTERLCDRAWVECDWSEKVNYDEVSFWLSDKYSSDTEDTLNSIAEEFPIREGYVEFCGEDYTYWKFEFDKRSNKFVEVYGRVVYDDEIPPVNGKVNENNRAEFIGQIIDVFEDFLESKGIEIWNEDKTQSDNPAILYGMDYGEIQSGIEEIMHSWEVFK